MHHPACGCWSRRSILAAAASVAFLPARGAPAPVPSRETPAEAQAALLAGNRRFMAHDLRACTEDLATLRQSTKASQAPFAAVLACSDSRVPVEMIFDQTIGRIFVARVAGNVASAEVIASLEYGAAVLGTRTILVLGHGNCGAVAAAMAGKPAPGQITALYRSLRPAIDEAGGDLVRAIEANARIQAKLLRDSSPVLAGLVGAGKLGISAGYYDLATGEVRLLGA